jgi:hypothetical protein
MLFRDVITLYPEIPGKHIKTLSEKHRVFNVKAVATCNS